MNLNSPSDSSTTSRSETTPGSSPLGTEKSGSEKLTSGSGCSAGTSAECSPEPTTQRQLSFCDCESSATTSKVFEPVSVEQLELKVAPTGKRCYSCTRLLPIECFAKIRNRNDPGREFLNPRCNQCRARRDAGSPRVLRNKEYVNKLKEAPCTDCGGKFPSVCMDFDHVHGEKRFNVSEGVNFKSFDVLVAELAKCELVCANCHRLRSQSRLADKTQRHRVGRKGKFLAEVHPDLTEVRPGHRSPWRDGAGV